MIGFIMAGFAAQLVDGTLGMAYGVTLTSLLTSMGLPQAIASMVVHAAELVTTGVSGLSHWRAGNVDWPLAKRLILPGVLGGALGAYALTHLDGDALRPYVAVYLAGMGLLILYRSVKSRIRSVRTCLPPLGLAGGFMDALGGGWGPVVTSTLLARGNAPRQTVGSVNLAEWFVTTAESATFIVALGSGKLIQYAPLIGGLLIGGVLAAPLAAVAAKRLPARPFMFLVGCLVLALNVRTLLTTPFCGVRWRLP